MQDGCFGEKNRKQLFIDLMIKNRKIKITAKFSQEKFYRMIKTMAKERPEKADIIIWIQGDRYDRAAKTLSLYKKGWAKKILLVGNNVLVGEKTAETTDNISLIDMMAWLIKKGVRRSAIICDDQAFNTYDQAANAIKLAIKRGWKRMILVASFYHQPRVFLSFLKNVREKKWLGKIINQPTKINWRKKPGGRTMSAAAVANEEINKIKKYKLV